MNTLIGAVVVKVLEDIVVYKTISKDYVGINYKTYKEAAIKSSVRTESFMIEKLIEVLS